MSADRVMRALNGVGTAFFGRFPRPNEVQQRAIPPILAGKNVLVASATASGKTEAVLAPMIARMRRRRVRFTMLLVIAPTRALVNDLERRLFEPLSQIGWTLGRQSSDSQGKLKRPNVLITTPESFDSMLVRGATNVNDVYQGHILENVRGVFLDEVHVLHGSPRGEQVRWLLARLRRIREHAQRGGRTEDSEVQVCAASATVDDPTETAEVFLGRSSETVTLRAGRPMFLVSPGTKEPRTSSLSDGLTPSDVRRGIDVLYGYDVAAICSLITGLLWQKTAERFRKLLVFCPSRDLCDTLADSLVPAVARFRNAFVGCHHGSLGRGRREHVERQFAKSSDAIVVATSTLEIGIDIGDIDAVILVGAPPSVCELLQRTGRSGRKTDRVLVMPIAGNECEAWAISSMLIASSLGQLDYGRHKRHYSVLLQQLASYMWQSRRKERTADALLSLAKDVWPDVTDLEGVIRELCEAELLVQRRGAIKLGQELTDLACNERGALHVTFSSDQRAIPFRDASSGDVIAYIAEPPERSKRIRVGGESWSTVRSEDGEVVARKAKSGRGGESAKYSTVAMPMSRSFASHVGIGIGFSPSETAVIEFQGRQYWLHFGGAAYEEVLRLLVPSVSRVARMSGIGVCGVVQLGELRALDVQQLGLVVRRHCGTLVRHLGVGRFHKLLPERLQAEEILELFDVRGFLEWTQALRITEVRKEDPRHQICEATLFGGRSYGKMTDVVSDADHT